MEKSFATRCVHAGEGHNPFGAHATPIYQTSTYVFESAEQAAAAFSGGSGYRYIRSPPNTPTHAVMSGNLYILDLLKARPVYNPEINTETIITIAGFLGAILLLLNLVVVR